LRTELATTVKRKWILHADRWNVPAAMRQLCRLPSIALSLPILVSTIIVALHAAESIVGSWSTTQDCKPIDTIHVSPMALVGEDWDCTFKSVTRRGDVVTWRGRCGNAIHDNDQATTIVARLSGGQLHLSDNGKSMGTYRRCK
jgi:hypothetical protein